MVTTKFTNIGIPQPENDSSHKNDLQPCDVRMDAHAMHHAHASFLQGARIEETPCPLRGHL